ncbi:MAG: hypothetical protein M5U19_23390 [Microthrixaceae bacterium]|nr:hypothetical protein [Microthrixaceae bacterium]
MTALTAGGRSLLPAGVIDVQGRSRLRMQWRSSTAQVG